MGRNVKELHKESIPDSVWATINELPAQLNLPMGVSAINVIFDEDGNLYIGDYKINKQTLLTNLGN